MPELTIKPLKIRVAKGLITLVPEDRNQVGPEAPLVIDHVQKSTIEMMVAMLRENRLRDEREYQVLGENLWAVLLDNKIGEALHDALQTDGQMIRVELEFGGDQLWLARWPWEHLYCPLEPTNEQTGYFLARRTSRLLLTRQIGLRSTRRLLVQQPPVRVLFVVASPDASDDCEPLAEVQYLRLHEELQEFVTSLEGRIELVHLITPHKRSKEYIPNEKPKATYANFTEMLTTLEPHVVHFVGHGRCVANGGEVAFVGPDYKADWVSGSRIAEAFMDRQQTRLVFLQACESALPDPYQAISGVAMQLAHRNIPAVVAMQYKVENAVASDFARAFYGALVKSRPVDAAVQEARDKIAAHVSDWAQGRAFGLPVLYLRQFEALMPSEDQRGGRFDRPVAGKPVDAGAVPARRPTPAPGGDRLDQSSIDGDVLACPWCHTPYVPSPTKNFCSNADCVRRLVCPLCRTRLRLGEEKVCGCCGSKETDWTKKSSGTGVFDHVG